MNLLQVSHLMKRFDGVVVTDDVTLGVASSSVHAIIGPNGAGKTTLINQIAGELRPDEGTVQLDGEDITGLSVHKRAQRGLARSFQISNVFHSLSAEDNVGLSIQARQGHSFRFWTPVSGVEELRVRAQMVLAQAGLKTSNAATSAVMGYGDRRQLELAMATAGRPKVLLLDEPMAGLSLEESAEMVAFLRKLKRDYAILLVEHDMDAVFSLADQVTVLFSGRILASGPPDAIRNDPAVRVAYLGDDHTNATIKAQVVPIPKPKPAPKPRAQVPGKQVLKIEQVEAGYGASRVLFGISLEVRAGEVIALLGRNGMGKSTLLKVITGAVLPSAGTIIIQGKDVTGRPIHEITELGIGVVPEGRRIFRSLTVEENLVATATLRRSIENPWTLERVYGLFPRLKERPSNLGNQLSGGEQQMLAIGRALMTNPMLLILDEATEGLAPLIRADIWRIIGELKALGQSIVVVDKNLDAVSKVADRLYVLEKGKIVWNGTSDDLDADKEKIYRHVSV
jgi:branched-chain amino acid transport system ATP-binding protein